LKQSTRNEEDRKIKCSRAGFKTSKYQEKNQLDAKREKVRGEAKASEGGQTMMRYVYLKKNGGLEQKKQKVASL
jgi:hypothetical protein